MVSQAAPVETVDSQALLWALADFRADVERLIEEHKAVVLGLPVFATPAEPAPAPVPVAYLPAQGAEAGAPEPDPTPRKATRPGAKAWAREPAATPAAEPAETPAHEPSRAEDARQRLDALAAKLLDRRQKQSAADPARNPRDR